MEWKFKHHGVITFFMRDACYVLHFRFYLNLLPLDVLDEGVKATRPPRAAQLLMVGL